MLPNTNQENPINQPDINKKDDSIETKKVLEKIVDIFNGGNSQLKNIQSKTINILVDASKTLTQIEKQFKEAFSIEVNKSNDDTKSSEKVSSKTIKPDEVSVPGKSDSSVIDNMLNKIVEKMTDWLGKGLSDKLSNDDKPATKPNEVNQVNQNKDIPSNKTDEVNKVTDVNIKDVKATKPNEVNQVNQNKDILTTIFDSLMQSISGKDDGKKGKPEIALENLIKIEEKILSVLVAIEKVGVETNQSLSNFEKTVLNALADSTQETRETNYENSLKKQPIEKIDIDTSNQKKEEKKSESKKDSSEESDSSDGIGEKISDMAEDALDDVLEEKSEKKSNKKTKKPRKKVGSVKKAGKSILGKLGGAMKKIPSVGMSTIGRIGKSLKGGVGIGAVVGLGTDIAADIVGRDNAAGASLDVLSSAASGASTGALIGSVIPGIGTGIGAAVGGAIGAAKGLYDNAETLAEGKGPGTVEAEKEAIKNFSEYDLSMNDPAMFKEYSEFKKKRIEEISSNKEVSPDNVEAVAKKDAILYITKKIKDKKASTEDAKKAKTVSPEEIKTEDTSKVKSAERKYEISDLEESQKDPEKFKEYSQFKKQTYDSMMKNGENIDFARTESENKAIELYYPEKVSASKKSDMGKSAPSKADAIESRDMLPENNSKANTLERSQDELDDIMKTQKASATQAAPQNNIISNNNQNTTIMPSRQSTKNMEFSLNRYLDKNFA